MSSIYVVLLHSPMVDKNNKEVTTAVTNLDIHDIARSCKTYGVSKYFVVNPEPEQERMVGAILDHWRRDISKVYHPDRTEALSSVEYKRTFEEAYNTVLELENQAAGLPLVVMPDARDLSAHFQKAWSYEEFRQALECDGEEGSFSRRPVLIVFGTGWGISPSFFPKVDLLLKPLRKKQNGAMKSGTNGKDYNHLSVRSAVAIILDRLFGERF